MALIPLEKHNEERRKVHDMLEKQARGNGIACPNCGKELIDSDPMSTLTSSPPKKKVSCPACGYSGYRVA